MLFNSFEYVVFLPIVFILYWFVLRGSLKGQNSLILLASYFFYGWWSWQFLGLLILSTLLDFAYGFGVASENKKKAKLFLWLSIINNLGILGIFKYYNFFAEQFRQAFETIGIECHPVFLQVALPVGISFYTFHGMSYVFDIYRNKQEPIKNMVDYAVFVSFFPLLVAGPIERANHLLPQIQKARVFNYAQALSGFRLILWGLFKKVVIADSLAGPVDHIFKTYDDQNGITLIIGAIGFSFQIYGDFSGYSDIALGTAKLFGFELLSNFRFPYFSRNLGEFWRRWHISLSSWFRDYLYIPLGGSRQGKLKTIRNTFIIFIVSGFWHGASWNFIVWGFLHACGLLPQLLLQNQRKQLTDVVAQNRLLPSFKEVRQMLSTFAMVTFAWIFFRADTMGIALAYIKRMAVSILEKPRQLIDLEGFSLIAIYVIPLLLIDWYQRHDERTLKSNLIFDCVLLCILLILGFDTSKSFIYFVF